MSDFLEEFDDDDYFGDYFNDDEDEELDEILKQEYLQSSTSTTSSESTTKIEKNKISFLNNTNDNNNKWEKKNVNFINEQKMIKKKYGRAVGRKSKEKDDNKEVIINWKIGTNFIVLELEIFSSIELFTPVPIPIPIPIKNENENDDFLKFVEKYVVDNEKEKNDEMMNDEKNEHMRVSVTIDESYPFIEIDDIKLKPMINVDGVFWGKEKLKEMLNEHVKGLKRVKINKKSSMMFYEIIEMCVMYLLKKDKKERKCEEDLIPMALLKRENEMKKMKEGKVNIDTKKKNIFYVKKEDVVVPDFKKKKKKSNRIDYSYDKWKKKKEVVVKEENEKEVQIDLKKKKKKNEMFEYKKDIYGSVDYKIGHYMTPMKICKHLKEMRKKKEYTDFRILIKEKDVEDQEILVHKCVLYARSSYFKKLFKKEPEKGTIIIGRYTHYVVECYISFLYDGSLVVNGRENMDNVLNLSKEWGREKEILELYNSTHRDLFNILKKQDLTDLDIYCVVNDSHQKGHKVFLTVSSFINKILHSGMIEQIESKLMFESISFDSLKNILLFYYTEDVDVLNICSRNSVELIIFANLFQISIIEDRCRKNIIQNVNLDNAVDIINIFSIYKDERIIERCKGIIVRQYTKKNLPLELDRLNDEETRADLKLEFYRNVEKKVKKRYKKHWKKYQQPYQILKSKLNLKCKLMDIPLYDFKDIGLDRFIKFN